MNTTTQNSVLPHAWPETESQSLGGDRVSKSQDAVKPNRRLESESQSAFVLPETANETAIDAWPDAWLVAAICRDSPDSSALDELAQRHWRKLLGQCRVITMKSIDAADLAQEAWCRVLRSRHNLKPEGNFPGYLHMIARNLWRDRRRSENRAGTLAASRVTSLETTVADHDGNTTTVGDGVPDTYLMEAEHQARLNTDLDQALGRVAPTLRGVLVARFLMGESCAEIGRRHRRTEQTVSGWVRQGVQEMKRHFLEIRDGLSIEGSL